jgi:hypothetical protein
MEPSPRSTFEPAGAGARLGILGGAFVGVPAGVFAVYKRYRDTF